MEVRYEGTMRGCHSKNVTDRGYCANQNSVLPSDDSLHPWNALPSLRNHLAGSSAIVILNGKKCVSDKNGIFPLFPTSKAALLECNMIAIIALFIVCRKIS